MAESYADEEARISKACDALERFEKPNIARAARDFNVNERKLRNRFNGIPSKSEYGGHNKTLTDDQELAVCHYLDRMDKTGIFARPRMLRSVANSILARNHNDLNTPPPLVGPNWPRRFLARHPEYFKRKLKPLAHDRKNTHDPADIRAHFEKFQAACIFFGIVFDDIWNYDETGFRVGVGRAHEIITRLKNRRLYLSDPDNRESVTLVETISAGGAVLDPFIILPGVNHLHKAFQDLFGNTLVGV